MCNQSCLYINHNLSLVDYQLFSSGVLLAVLEKFNVFEHNELSTNAGTISAGYQNFLICIEMLFASIALRAAFPYQIYKSTCVTDSSGRSVTMQSISSSLKVRFLSRFGFILFSELVLSNQFLDEKLAW